MNNVRSSSNTLQQPLLEFPSTPGKAAHWSNPLYVQRRHLLYETIQGQISGRLSQERDIVGRLRSYNIRWAAWRCEHADAYWMPKHCLEPLEKGTRYLCRSRVLSLSWSHRSGSNTRGSFQIVGSRWMKWEVDETGVCLKSAVALLLSTCSDSLLVGCTILYIPSLRL